MHRIVAAVLAWALFVSQAWAYYPGPQAASATATLATATGNATTAYKLMGLAGAITPKVAGRLRVVLSGDAFSATLADGGTVVIYYGTGTAPSNGATGVSPCGTTSCATAGSAVKFVAATTAERAPFGLSAIVTGLTVGTAYWIDIGLLSSTTVTATVENISMTAQEF